MVCCNHLSTGFWSTLQQNSAVLSQKGILDEKGATCMIKMHQEESSREK